MLEFDRTIQERINSALNSTGRTKEEEKFLRDV